MSRHSEEMAKIRALIEKKTITEKKVREKPEKPKKEPYKDPYVVTPEKQEEIWRTQSAAQALVDRLRREGKL